MLNHIRPARALRGTLIPTFLLLFALAAFGQEGHWLKGKLIQANAMGTSTQLGSLIAVNIRINRLSTAAERSALIESFTARGNEGLVNALSKMESKGRISLPSTVGYDINFIREIRNKDGSITYRLITDRPIAIGELWYSSRSKDYSLTALEITFTRDKKGKYKGKGVLLPACEFKLDKENRLEIEARQNPWNLTHIQVR
jgi:hypothetical protein